MDISLIQKKFIFEYKKILKKNIKNKIDISLSSILFVSTWSENIGGELLKKNVYKGTKFTRLLITLLKDWYCAIKYSQIAKLNEFKINCKKKIIISTCSIEDFEKSGHYNDRYLNINSKEYKNFYFVLFYTSELLPKKINKNILLVRKKTNFVVGILKFLKIFFYLIIKNKIKFIIHKHSDHTVFADNFFSLLKKNFQLKRIDLVFLPYEGFPYQQKIFLEIKKINPKVITAGYDHSAPHALPLNMHYRLGAPDFIFVNGQNQALYLNKFLGWPLKKIIQAPSLRYRKDSKEKFDNIIFLPWKIYEEKNVLSSFENYIKIQKNNSLKPFLIKTHPVAVNQFSQQKFKKSLEDIINKYKVKFSRKVTNKSISIFIGSTTAVIVALEKGLNVLHICFDPKIESYSGNLWPNLIVSQIFKNTFVYELKKKGSFIQFGNKNKLFNKFYIKRLNEKFDK